MVLRPTWQRYGAAIAAVLLGWIAREALTQAVGPTSLPFIFFFPAVAASAWFGGLGPGVLAMFLGAIGIYGVMAHLVSQRTHEIGIRIALGASPLQVMRLVVGQGLKLAMIGVGAGVIVALGTTRALVTLLYEVTPNDLLTFIAVPLLFATVALAACYIPARRGMRVDPLVALRYE